MSTVTDYLRWYQESDADGDTMDTAELAVAYAKHCLSEELREVWAIHKSEIDALKAQRDALLAALQAMVGEYGEFYGDTPEVAAQSQSPLIKSALAAIAKARGESV